jgi:hypothetical protein
MIVFWELRGFLIVLDCRLEMGSSGWEREWGKWVDPQTVVRGLRRWGCGVASVLSHR